MHATYFIGLGAQTCCKSGEMDQSVCKVDKCELAVYECNKHAADFMAAQQKLTHPKAVEKDEHGTHGSCSLAIKNRVDQGKGCCTYGMKALGACITKKVGNIKLCKDKWNKVFGKKFHDQAEPLITAFNAGGFCAKVNPNPTKGTTTAAKGTTYTGIYIVHIMGRV